MIRCMHISDTHEENIADIVITDLMTKKKLSVDILFISGDLTYRGAFKKLKKVAEQCEDLVLNGYVSHIVVIPGNHDLTFQRNQDSWNNPRTALYAFEHIRNVHLLIHKEITIMGVKIFGSPWTPEFHGWAYNYYAKDAKAIWSEIPEDTQVLMTHGPPQFILDEVRNDYMKINYCGCPELARKIVNTPSIKYHLFGHIHEGYGTIEKNGIFYLNSSIMDGSYKPTNRPQYFTLKVKDNEYKGVCISEP